MREFAVVSTCHADGYESYGREMLATFDRHWPRSVKLHFYAEGFTPDTDSNRIQLYDLEESCPDLVAFKKRHAGNDLAHGRTCTIKRRLDINRHKRKLKLRRIEWGKG